MSNTDVRWFAVTTFFVLLGFKIAADVVPGIDWMPLWVAGHTAIADPPSLYDFDRITELQPEIYRDPDFRPFVYPPSTLFLVTPLAQLPFLTSLIVVSGVSLTGLLVAARKAGSDPILLAIAPPLLISAVVGQLSLIAIALAMTACLILRKHEKTGGALLGIAALIKPTLFVLAPISLVAGRYWRALALAGVTVLAGIALSIQLFGLQLWIDWAAALPRFHRMFADYPPLVRNAITPYAFGVRLYTADTAILAVFAVPAIFLTWLAFSQRSEPTALLTMMLGGALLISPYAMNYELGVLGPALMALRRDSFLNISIISIWAGSLFFNLGILGLICGYAAVAAPIILKWHQEPRDGETISA